MLKIRIINNESFTINSCKYEITSKTQQPLKSVASLSVNKWIENKSSFINILKSLFKKNNLQLPIVDEPIIFYATVKKITEKRELNKAAETANHNVPNDTSWDEKQSRKLLKKQ